jgi:hypothetical protein
LSALTASRSSITQEMLGDDETVSLNPLTRWVERHGTHLISLAPWEIISMLTLPSASVLRVIQYNVVSISARVQETREDCGPT